MIDAEHPFDSAHDTTDYSSYDRPDRPGGLIADRRPVDDSSGNPLSIRSCRERKCRNKTNRYHAVKSHNRAIPLVVTQAQLLFARTCLHEKKGGLAA